MLLKAKKYIKYIYVQADFEHQIHFYRISLKSATATAALKELGVKQGKAS